MSTSTKLVIILGTLGILISVLVWKCSPPKPSPVDLVTHDTVEKKIYIHDTTKGSVLDIPTKVTIYDTIPGDALIQLELMHDTLKLVKHDTVLQEVNSNFLTLFPTSPKLIFGQFTTNSITLNLLGIDGKVVGKQYNTDYSKFNYEFSGSELKFYPLKKTGNFIQQGLAALTTSAFMETYYNPIDKGATMRLEYNIMYKRIGATTHFTFSTDQIPHANIGLGVRVQLK